MTAFKIEDILWDKSKINTKTSSDNNKNIWSIHEILKTDTSSVNSKAEQNFCDKNYKKICKNTVGVSCKEETGDKKGSLNQLKDISKNVNHALQTDRKTNREALTKNSYKSSIDSKIKDKKAPKKFPSPPVSQAHTSLFIPYYYYCYYYYSNQAGAKKPNASNRIKFLDSNHFYSKNDVGSKVKLKDKFYQSEVGSNFEHDHPLVLGSSNDGHINQEKRRTLSGGFQRIRTSKIKTSIFHPYKYFDSQHKPIENSYNVNLKNKSEKIFQMYDNKKGTKLTPTNVPTPNKTFTPQNFTPGAQTAEKNQKNSFFPTPVTNVVEPATCKQCEKTYSSVGALKMHLKTHTLPCRCLLCGKSFSRPWLLQGHLRTHTGAMLLSSVYFTVIVLMMKYNFLAAKISLLGFS